MRAAQVLVAGDAEVEDVERVAPGVAIVVAFAEVRELEVALRADALAGFSM